jgi:hypothetical protein
MQKLEREYAVLIAGAGIAARLAAQRDTMPNQLDARAAQRELAQQRIPFHINDVIR